MANIHEVNIVGEVPFHLTEDNEVRSWLGLMNGPSLDLRIEYGRERYVPNEHGGKTAMYEFRISGREALRSTMLSALVKDFRRIGAVMTAQARDVENNGSWYDIT